MARRVLQVLSHSAGGIARHVATIQRWLDGTNDLTVDVAAPRGLPVTMPRQPIEIDIPRGPLGHRGAQRRLHKLVREGDYDVVHSHGLRAGMDAGRAARSLEAHRLVTVHNLVRKEIVGGVRAALYKRAELGAVVNNDRVLAVSTDIADHLKRLNSSTPIEVVHLGVEPPKATSSREDVKAKLGVPREASLVVSVARLDTQKALDVLIDAVAKLPGVVAVIVGTGPLRSSLEERATQSRVGDRVRFVGWREDVADVIGSADLFCLSSVWEGVPLAAQEAIALGIPVVATDVGGMRDLIKNGVSGRLVEPGRPEELARAIDQVLNDRAEAERFAIAARDDLQAEFSVDRMLDRLRALYEERR